MEVIKKKVKMSGKKFKKGKNRDSFSNFFSKKNFSKFFFQKNYENTH